MRWPWSRKPEPKAIEPIEDWEVCRSDWYTCAICHCGHRSDSIYPGTCPRCGCSDKWGSKTVRIEWERSYSRHRGMGWGICAYTGRHDSDCPWSRNRREVEWTPEHCEVGP